MRIDSTTLALRLGAAAAVAGLATLGLATTASAHVTATPSTTAAGAYTVVDLAFGHGCEGSPTERLDIKIPDGVYSVAPEVKSGWEVKKVMEQLDEPVDDGHGGQYTERVARVVYTADEPVDDGYYFSTALSLKLPDAEEGTRVEFPTVQGCTKGETAWIESTPESGEEPELPAPSFVLTAAEGGHGADDAAAEPADPEAADPEAETEPAEADDSTASVVGGVGAVAGVLGLLLGGIAFARTRKS